MKELMKLIRRLIALTIVTGIAAFPVLGVVQWFSPGYITPFHTYIQILSHLWSYIFDWGDWEIVVILSIIFFNSSHSFAQTAQDVRLKLVYKEMERWSKTPYISPVFYYYLVAMPGSYSSTLKEAALSRFYQTIVELFRNRVYMDSTFSEQSPLPKPSWIKVAGPAMLLPSIAGVSALIVFFIFLFKLKSPEYWFDGWDKFCIPFVLFIISWISQQLYALIKVSSGKDIELKIQEYFEEPDPRITWREVYPDRPHGETIIKAWKAARDQLQRNYYYFRNKPLPPDGKMVYDNPALPPYPYPHEQIPEWADEMEAYVYSKLNQWDDEEKNKKGKAMHSSRGKVVSMKKKRNLWK